MFSGFLITRSPDHRITRDHPIAIGAIGAVALTRLLEALQFRISPTDPPTLAGVAFLIAALTAIARYLPARRAVRVDPIDALRAE